MAPLAVQQAGIASPNVVTTLDVNLQMAAQMWPSSSVVDLDSRVKNAVQQDMSAEPPTNITQTAGHVKQNLTNSAVARVGMDQTSQHAVCMVSRAQRRMSI